MGQTPDAEQAEQRIERVLEEGLERVETPEAARAIIARLERLSAGQTEAERGDAAAEKDARSAGEPCAAAATSIERAGAPAGAATAQPATSEAGVADALLEVAAQSVAPSPAAEPVVAAAQATLPPSAPVSPPVRRGRTLLKEALLKRMGPLNAVDARIYLAVNEAPHPGFLDSLAWALAIVTTGGWIWVIATLVAHLVRIPGSWMAVKRLLPSVVVATWMIEYPIKAFFRRRRPFARIVEALVIGKKPGSWSFPSGHTASSFASAWILSTVWPSRTPLFFGLASAVGYSRIYLGAHYPGDVASGAVLGVLLSEAVRRLNRALFG
ncbi:MAG TPA: phosphatase PAP2 family protein [Chloroflexota bacterium]|nr:phosphatase PAP2 family protein [Chloroflexota bacterium]